MWNSVDPLGPLLYFQVQHYDKRTTAGITVMTKVSRLILLRNEGPCQPIGQASNTRWNVAGRGGRAKIGGREGRWEISLTALGTVSVKRTVAYSIIPCILNFLEIPWRLRSVMDFTWHTCRWSTGWTFLLSVTKAPDSHLLGFSYDFCQDRSKNTHSMGTSEV